MDAAERPIYAGWVAGAVERGVYRGFFIEKEGEVVAGAGLVRLEWGPSRGDPQAYRARLVNVWTKSFQGCEEGRVRQHGVVVSNGF